MDAQVNQVALPLRSHTIFGICEAVGEDFGFNPIFLRIPFSAIVLYSPLMAIGAYLALGVIVLASRMLFPARKEAVKPQLAAVAAQPESKFEVPELAKAA